MIRRPRFWLALAGCWLVLAGVVHLAAHVWGLVLENEMIGLREFTMNAMKQAQSPGPLRPSMWRQFRLYSVGFALLLLFAGSVDLLVAGLRASARTQQAFALLGTLFWTVAFVPFALVDPMMLPIAVSLIAVPLHAIAYLTASMDPDTLEAGEPTTTADV